MPERDATIKGLIDAVAKLRHDVNELMERPASDERHAFDAISRLGPIEGLGDGDWTPPGAAYNADGDLVRVIEPGAVEAVEAVPAADETTEDAEARLDGLVRPDRTWRVLNIAGTEWRGWFGHPHINPPLATAIAPTRREVIHILDAECRRLGLYPPDSEPAASASLARPDVAATLREAEQAPSLPASVPAPGFDVPRLREPIEAVKARLGTEGTDWRWWTLMDICGVYFVETLADGEHGRHVAAHGDSLDLACRDLDAKLRESASVPHLRDPVEPIPDLMDFVEKAAGGRSSFLTGCVRDQLTLAERFTPGPDDLARLLAMEPRVEPLGDYDGHLWRLLPRDLTARLREPVTVRPSAADAVGSVALGYGPNDRIDPAYRPPVADACTDDEENP